MHYKLFSVSETGLFAGIFAGNCYKGQTQTQYKNKTPTGSWTKERLLKNFESNLEP